MRATLLFLVLPLLLGACATAVPVPVVERPELASMAAPYAESLRSVGVTRLVVAGTGEKVRLDTGYGAVYIDYPAGVASTAFMLEISADGLRASAPLDDAALDTRVLATLMPEAMRVTAANNEFGWWRANPVR